MLSFGGLVKCWFSGEGGIYAARIPQSGKPIGDSCLASLGKKTWDSELILVRFFAQKSSIFKSVAVFVIKI